MMEQQEPIITLLANMMHSRQPTEDELSTCREFFRQLEEFIKSVIERATGAGMIAGQTWSAQSPKDIYKRTEQRLYSLPAIRQKVERDSKYLETLQSGDLPKRSLSIIRFQSSGMRLSEDEIAEVLIQDTEVQLAKDGFELDLLEGILDSLVDDPYIDTLTGKYFYSVSDDELSGDLNCDPSTVRRNRKRLVDSVAVMLYGTSAY